MDCGVFPYLDVIFGLPLGDVDDPAANVTEAIHSNRQPTNAAMIVKVWLRGLSITYSPLAMWFA